MDWIFIERQTESYFKMNSKVRDSRDLCGLFLFIFEFCADDIETSEKQQHTVLLGYLLYNETDMWVCIQHCAISIIIIIIIIIIRGFIVRLLQL